VRWWVSVCVSTRERHQFPSVLLQPLGHLSVFRIKHLRSRLSGKTANLCQTLQCVAITYEYVKYSRRRSFSGGCPYTVDYAKPLRDRDGSTRVVHDRHVEGLFSRERWLRALSDAGFEPRVVPFSQSELEPGRYKVFVAVRPA
jgi:hypothetical protein